MLNYDSETRLQLAREHASQLACDYRAAQRLAAADVRRPGDDARRPRLVALPALLARLHTWGVGRPAAHRA